VIRIWNNDITENLDGVLQRLLCELEKRPLTPALSPQAGREGDDWCRYSCSPWGHRILSMAAANSWFAPSDGFGFMPCRSATSVVN